MAREVRKRDNRIVPFDQSKIADAIYRALRSVGEGDRALAEELAAAVTHFLEERFADRIPGIEDIQDLVETVLMEMGHPRVAKAYILYRQKRTMMRESLQVRKDIPQGEGVSYDYAASEGRPPGSGEKEPPRVEDSQHGTGSGSGTWSKSKITAALIREADLDPSLADDIAAAVERKVMLSCAGRISTSLIRELVDNELFERGFSAKLQRQQPIGLPKYNLEQIIFGTDFKEGYTFPKTPSEVRDIVANRILQQYSLQEVYSPEVSDAHREGRLFIHRLSDPIRCARLRWHLPPPSMRRDEPAEVLGRSARPRPGGAAAGRRRSAGSSAPASFPMAEDVDAYPGNYLDLGDFFRRLSHLRQFAAEEMRLRGLSNLLLDPVWGGSRVRNSQRGALARHIVDRLSQEVDNPEIVLELDLSDASLPFLRAVAELPPAQTQRLIVSLRLGREDPGGRSGEGEGLWLGGGAEVPETARLAAELYGRGERIEFEPPPSTGLSQAAGEAREIGELAGEPPVGRGSHRSGGGANEDSWRDRLVWRRTLPQAASSHEAAPVFSGVLSKITVNLPRAAYRSGKDRRASMESELDAILDLAIKGHLERRQFAARLAQNRESPLWDLLGRQQGRAAPLDFEENVKFSVGILGLNECVKFLTGWELDQDPGARKMGVEIVSYISRKLLRERRGLGIRLYLEETDNLGPLHALEGSDRRLYPEIAEIDRGRRASTALGYTNGVRMHRAAPIDPLRRLECLAPFLPFVETARGVVEEVPELRSPDSELLLSLLEESIPALVASSSPAGGGPSDTPQG